MSIGVAYTHGEQARSEVIATTDIVKEYARLNNCAIQTGSLSRRPFNSEVVYVWKVTLTLDGNNYHKIMKASDTRKKALDGTLIEEIAEVI